MDTLSSAKLNPDSEQTNGPVTQVKQDSKFLAIKNKLIH